MNKENCALKLVDETIMLIIHYYLFIRHNGDVTLERYKAQQSVVILATNIFVSGKDKSLKLHPVAGTVKILTICCFGLLFLLIVWTDLK